MPLQETSGAASYDAFGGGVAAVPNYIEDVFSTYLYTGNGSTQTITNGIDLSGEGGLVWCKNRGATSHGILHDTARGVTKYLLSSLTSAEATNSTGDRLTAFNSDGFSLGTDPGSGINASANTYASWTFREQAKFFDIVTYTGTGSNRTVAHNLGSVPGCIIVKRTDTAAAWDVYHRSIANTEYMVLNTTAAKATGTNRWDSTTPTSTEFSLGTATTVNASGGTYVAYIFAHDASGFGLSGTDNVISCESYTGNGSATGPVVTLGYEPQWLLVKNTTSTGDWNLIDNMRGFVVGGADAELNPNLSDAESTGTFVTPTATGFQVTTTDAGYNTSSATYIYIAIRRGPMEVPTSGTSVFSPNFGANSADQYISTGFNPDLAIHRHTVGVQNNIFQSRLVGQSSTSQNLVLSNSSSGEFSTTGQVYFGPVSQGYNIQTARTDALTYAMLRAPGFFDVVCDTGTGSAHTISHNLGVIPELVIRKKRSASDAWVVYANNDNTDYLVFNTTAATVDDNTMWNDTSPTASVFTVGTNDDVNQSTGTFVTYLFATCPGVSKVGSYTGTGTTQTINCGFTAGARFVMIKRTDSTGDWYVWDSARGIVAGNDPYLLINSTAAEVTSTDYVDTAAAGFELSSTAPAAINANGGTFIFLAIA